MFLSSSHSPDSNELLLTDEPVTVLVHLAEQLLGLAHIAALRPHHLVDGRDDPASKKPVNTCLTVTASLPPPLHLVELYTAVTVHIVHAKCPGQLLLRSA